MTARTQEYARLAAQGMTATEIAAATGVHLNSVRYWAKRHGVDLPDARKLPAHAERMRVQMRKLHADPAYAAAHAERMRVRRADPNFVAAHASGLRAFHTESAFNPLAALTAAERADYDTLKRAHYSRNEALTAIGRTDLIREGRA